MNLFTAFVCTAVCQDLAELENGVIVYNTEESPREVGTIATHSCNEGYILVGVVNRTCLESTEFNESPPTCQRKLTHSNPYVINTLYGELCIH